MDKLPMVTIVIANHNYSDYVGRAIRSAYTQTYPNCQLGIIDDGSTDNSVEEIKKATSDPKFETYVDFCQPCMGASEARNRIIRHMWDTTDYFLILDADDECYPEKVATLVEKAMQSPDQIGVVYADYHILNTKTGNIIHESKRPYDAYQLEKECIVHSQALISKVALQHTAEPGKDGDVNFYDPNLHGPKTGGFIGCCEDYDLWIRISEQFMIVHIPEPLSLVRVTGQNQSTLENVTPEIWQANTAHIRQKAIQRQNA